MATYTLKRKDRNRLSVMASGEHSFAGEDLSGHFGGYTPQKAQKAAAIIGLFAALREQIGWADKFDKSHKGRRWEVDISVLLACLRHIRADRMDQMNRLLPNLQRADGRGPTIPESIGDLAHEIVWLADLIYEIEGAAAEEAS